MPIVFCPNSVVWGDIGTWVGGGATALTLLLLAYQWWRRWRIEQANHIYAWLSREGEEPDPVTRIGNASGLPAYDLYVYYVLHQQYWPDGAWWRSRLASRWLGMELLTAYNSRKQERAARERKSNSEPLPADNPYDPARVQVLPPGDYELDKSLRFLAQHPRLDFSHTFAVELVFRDSNGRRWTRRASGKLKRTHVNPFWFNAIHYRRERMMRDFLMSGGGDMYTRLIPVSRPIIDTGGTTE